MFWLFGIYFPVLVYCTYQSKSGNTDAANTRVSNANIGAELAKTKLLELSGNLAH
jgi:hypothetical protein